MNWELKKFNDLSIDELYEIFKIRSEVFVVEQSCPYQDLDSKDKKSWHLFARDNDKIIAYLRILPKGISYSEASLGRVLVKKNYRGRGISKEMMNKAINFVVNEMNEDKIRISAQAYLVDFYKSLGFEEKSDIYLEDDIPHLNMLYCK